MAYNNKHLSSHSFCGSEVQKWLNWVNLTQGVTVNGAGAKVICRLDLAEGTPARQPTHLAVGRRKHNAFYDLVSKASHCYFCFVPFLRRESPSSVHTQEEEI